MRNDDSVPALATTLSQDPLPRQKDFIPTKKRLFTFIPTKKCDEQDWIATCHCTAAARSLNKQTDNRAPLLAIHSLLNRQQNKILARLT